jgi:hypothetical protein
VSNGSLTLATFASRFLTAQQIITPDAAKSHPEYLPSFAANSRFHVARVADKSNEFVRLLEARCETPSKLENLLALRVPEMRSWRWCPPVFMRVESSAVSILFSPRTSA